MSENDNKKNKKPPEIDLRDEKNHSVALEFLGNAAAMLANDAGAAVYATPVVTWIFENIQKFLPKVVIDNIMFPGMATFLHEPKFLKDLVRKAGLPEQVNTIIDDVIDDGVEGMRNASVRDGKLTQKSATSALDAARVSLKEKLEAVKTFEECFELLTPAEQARFDELLKQLEMMGEDSVKEFDAYRPKLTSVRTLRVVLQQSPTATQMLGFLKRTRPIKEPQKSGIVSFVDGVTKAVGSAVKRLTDPITEEEKTKTAQHEEDIKNDTKKIKDRRANRGW